eukprot:4439917-Pleurochrysis_carterae.AAC.1
MTTRPQLPLPANTCALTTRLFGVMHAHIACTDSRTTPRTKAHRHEESARGGEQFLAYAGAHALEQACHLLVPQELTNRYTTNSLQGCERTCAQAHAHNQAGVHAQAPDQR